METEKTEGVVGVAGYLCEGPSQDHGGVDGARVGGGEAGDDGPDEDQAGGDLGKGGGEGGPDETEEDMEDLECGERLDGGEHGPRVRIGGRYVGEESRGDMGRERVGSGVVGGGAGGEAGEGGDEDDGPAERRDDVEREQIHAYVTERHG